MIKKYLEDRKFKKQMKAVQEVQARFLKDATNNLIIKHNFKVTDERTVEIIDDLQALFGQVEAINGIFETLVYLDSDEKQLIKAMLQNGGTHVGLLELIEDMQENAQFFVQEFGEDL